jgi:hypothetical protein
VLELFLRPDPRWPDGPRWIVDADAALDAAGIEPLASRFRGRTLGATVPDFSGGASHTHVVKVR